MKSQRVRHDLATEQQQDTPREMILHTLHKCADPMSTERCRWTFVCVRVLSRIRLIATPSGSSVHGDSAGKNTGVGCHALLQGIFPTQGLNPGLPHCRQILYHLSHQKSPQELLAWRGLSLPWTQKKSVVNMDFHQWAWFWANLMTNLASRKMACWNYLKASLGDEMVVTGPWPRPQPPPPSPWLPWLLITSLQPGTRIHLFTPVIEPDQVQGIMLVTGEQDNFPTLKTFIFQ